MRVLPSLAIILVSCQMEAPRKEPEPAADPTVPITRVLATNELVPRLAEPLERELCAPCANGVVRVGAIHCGTTRVGELDCALGNGARFDERVTCTSDWTVITHCPKPALHACDEPCIDGQRLGRRMGDFVCGQNDSHVGRIECAYKAAPASVVLPDAPCKGGAWEPRTRCEYPAECNAGPEQCCEQDGRIRSARGAVGDGMCRSWDGSCWTCICLAAHTRIAVPGGSIPVTELFPGMLVLSRTRDGQLSIVPVLRTTRTPVPDTHHVIHLVLDDGRMVDVSPGHPDAGGAGVEHLVAGTPYDGSTITSAERIAYRDGATYDLLPAGDTGVYWADGVPLGSTLR